MIEKITCFYNLYLNIIMVILAEEIQSTSGFEKTWERTFMF